MPHPSDETPEEREKRRKKEEEERKSAKWIPFKGLLGQAADALKKRDAENKRRIERDGG